MTKNIKNIIDQLKDMAAAPMGAIGEHVSAIDVAGDSPQDIAGNTAMEMFQHVVVDTVLKGIHDDHVDCAPDSPCKKAVFVAITETMQAYALAALWASAERSATTFAHAPADIQAAAKADWMRGAKEALDHAWAAGIARGEGH